ncbi:GNAT family N-acetyltransferase [bacterium]|jgi:GrpB-like predicted nucleotidyltransferase (UPF0157 family)|nr:GNAT family N-acetyltransferase [bacterium]
MSNGVKIELNSYDPNWKTQFETEKQRLHSIIGKNSSIEHIGSTAIEGLCAKPVIDILIGIDHFSDPKTLITKISGLGYDYISEYEQQLPERRYFQKVRNGHHFIHIHLVERNSRFWQRHLFFRNQLSLYPELRNQYARLKQNLAQIKWKSRNDYASAKGEFIQKVEAKLDAFQWETERLIVKLPDTRYLDLYYRLLKDPDVMKYIGDGTNNPVTKNVAMTGIENLLKHFYQFGYTLGFVFLKNSNELIGRAGLVHIKGNSDEPIEVAYMLDKPYWNQGYGTELACYFIDWGFTHLKTDLLVGISHPDHKASQNVLKKCGMTLVGDYKYGDIKSMLYQIIKNK